MILVLTEPQPDYLTDQIADGLFTVFGVGRVVDWPSKANLHHGERLAYDSDCAWPAHGRSEDEVLESLRDGTVELLVVPSLRGEIPARLRSWAPFLRRLSDRIVYVDGEDDQRDSMPQFEEHAGVRPAAYFKRELPQGKTWARPLPFSYPERRIVAPGGARRGLVYDVQIWPRPPGVRARLRYRVRCWLRRGASDAREKLGPALRRLGSDAIVRLHHDGRTRTPPAQYQAEIRQALVGVAPAGAGYFTNRHFEILAGGCALVAERPWVQFPDAPAAPAAARYFRGPDEAVRHARELLADPDMAVAMATAGQRNLLEHHTTACRARTVWRAIHGAPPGNPASGRP